MQPTITYKKTPLSNLTAFECGLIFPEINNVPAIRERSATTAGHFAAC